MLCFSNIYDQVKQYRFFTHLKINNADSRSLCKVTKIKKRKKLIILHRLSAGGTSGLVSSIRTRLPIV